MHCNSDDIDQPFTVILFISTQQDRGQDNMNMPTLIPPWFQVSAPPFNTFLATSLDVNIILSKNCIKDHLYTMTTYLQ